MKFFLGILFFAAYLLFGRWYWVCEVRHECYEEPVVETRAKNLQFKDGDEVILEGYEQFAFKQNEIIPDLTDDNREFLDAVAEYLRQNPEKNIRLTVRQRPDETGSFGIYESIGLARANWLESYFERRGIDRNRVIPEIETADVPPAEAIAFDSFTAENPDDYNQVGTDFMNMTYSDANFAFNSDVFEPGDAALLYLDSVKTFLSENPTYELQIMGHTDSIASQQYNYDLGLRRAANAKTYLENLGVETEITTDSRGKLEPVSPNQTEAGRQRNRRVNFLITEKATAPES